MNDLIDVCVVGCVSADSDLVPSSVHPTREGRLDPEPAPPHGEILQVSRAHTHTALVITDFVRWRNCSAGFGAAHKLG